MISGCSVLFFLEGGGVVGEEGLSKVFVLGI